MTSPCSIELLSNHTAYCPHSNLQLQQQARLREGYRGIAEYYTTYVEAHEDVNWPNVTIPRYERTSRLLMDQAGIEFWNIFPLVKRGQEAAWIEYANATYERWVEEGHMIADGNLDRLDPVGYHPFISQRSPDGFVPDDERDFYFPGWVFSPPPANYGILNWNIQTVPDYGKFLADVCLLVDMTTR